jgi:thiaminase
MTTDSNRKGDEEWKRECLVRWIMRQPKDQRQEFYRSWDRKYGPESTRELMADVRAAWERSTSSPSIPERMNPDGAVTAPAASSAAE